MGRESMSEDVARYVTEQHFIEESANEFFPGDERALTYLDSITWQISERLGKPHYVPARLGVAESSIPGIISRIAHRYADPVGALKEIDELLGRYNGCGSTAMIKMGNLNFKDEDILEKQPTLTHLANKSLEIRLEEILFGEHERSGNVGIVSGLRDEVSPGQENAIRALEDTG